MCDCSKICYLEELLSPQFFLSPTETGPSGFFKKSPAKSRLFVYETCTSSLDVAWKLIWEGQMDEGDSVLCRNQTRGRGRMGRQWSSCDGNLLAAWKISCPQSRVFGKLLPLIMGFCFRQAFLNLGLSLMIKWPNDLIFENKKIGGILIEEKLDKLVAGIGINIAGCPHKSQMREQSPVDPGRIGPHLSDPDPVRLWAKLVSRAHFWYEDTLDSFSVIDFIREINFNLWLMGESVFVDTGRQTVQGTLLGVDHEGQLIIETSAGVVHMSEGSVSRCPC
ncbi:MAG: biotin--[acetyl-CoA-carboxylase] ligase [Desulfonatronovibrio sp.]